MHWCHRAPGVQSDRSDTKKCYLWNGWKREMCLCALPYTKMMTLSPATCTTRKLGDGRKKKHCSTSLCVGLQQIHGAGWGGPFWPAPPVLLSAQEVQQVLQDTAVSLHWYSCNQQLYFAQRDLSVIRDCAHITRLVHGGVVCRAVWSPKRQWCITKKGTVLTRVSGLCGWGGRGGGGEKFLLCPPKLFQSVA